MNEFWSAMAPWLILAVLFPSAVVVGLKLMPTDEWAKGLIREWAEVENLEVISIDESRGFARLRSSTRRVYRVRVQDDQGKERVCKAVVGRFMLGGMYQNISITCDDV